MCRVISLPPLWNPFRRELKRMWKWVPADNGDFPSRTKHFATPCTHGDFAENTRRRPKRSWGGYGRSTCFPLPRRGVNSPVGSNSNPSNSQFFALESIAFGNLLHNKETKLPLPWILQPQFYFSWSFAFILTLQYVEHRYWSLMYAKSGDKS